MEDVYEKFIRGANTTTLKSASTAEINNRYLPFSLSVHWAVFREDWQMKSQCIPVLGLYGMFGIQPNRASVWLEANISNPCQYFGHQVQFYAHDGQGRGQRKHTPIYWHARFW
jgi:hypothetical protein